APGEGVGDRELVGGLGRVRIFGQGVGELADGLDDEAEALVALLALGLEKGPARLVGEASCPARIAASGRLLEEVGPALIVGGGGLGGLPRRLRAVGPLCLARLGELLRRPGVGAGATGRRGEGEGEEGR